MKNLSKTLLIHIGLSIFLLSICATLTIIPVEFLKGYNIGKYDDTDWCGYELPENTNCECSHPLFKNRIDYIFPFKSIGRFAGRYLNNRCGE